MSSKSLEVRRRRVVSLVRDGGVPVAVCAKRYRVHTRSIRRWLRSYDESGIEALKSKRKPGRVPRLSRVERALRYERVKAGPRSNGYVVTTHWAYRYINGLARRLFGGPRDVGEIPERILHHAYGFRGWISMRSMCFVRPQLPKPPPISEHQLGPYGLGPLPARRLESLLRLERSLKEEHKVAAIIDESGLRPAVQAVSLLARGYPPKLAAQQTDQTREEVLRQFRRFLNSGSFRARSQVEIISVTARELIVARRIEGMAIAQIARMPEIEHMASHGMVRKFLSTLDMSRRDCACSRSKILGWDCFDPAARRRLCNLLEAH